MATVAVRPRRRRPMSRTQLARRIVQAGFLGFIVFAALRHNLFEEATSASIDALCPFGGVETLWTWITTDLAALLTALELPADTDPGAAVRDLVEAGLVSEVDEIRTAVAALQQ